VIDPLFWLALSFLLVAVCLTAVLLALIPATQELGRAARSVEKLCDTINRELPPTLESIRLTSTEITELTDDVTEGVQHAGRVVQQVDQGFSGVKQQAQRVQISTRSVMAGMRAALGSFTKGKSTPSRRDRRRLSASSARPLERLERLERAPNRTELPASSGHQNRSHNPDNPAAGRNGGPPESPIPDASMTTPSEQQAAVPEES
jgi:uncharacterized protein YoxC